MNNKSLNVLLTIIMILMIMINVISTAMTGKWDAFLSGASTMALFTWVGNIAVEYLNSKKKKYGPPPPFNDPEGE